MIKWLIGKSFKVLFKEINDKVDWVCCSYKILGRKFIDYEALRKETNALSGKVKILEEQHEIMHNFLVEINKYLVKLTDENQKGKKMGYQSMGDKFGSKRSSKSENNEGRVEKRAEKDLKDKKYKNQYKEQKGMK